MGNGNPWSQQRRQKRRMQQEMQAFYEREYLMDEDERDEETYGKSKKRKNR